MSLRRLQNLARVSVVAVPVVLAQVAGSLAQSPSHSGNFEGGCHDSPGKWTYADDGQKQATARGQLGSIGTNPKDGDLHMPLYPASGSEGLLVDPNHRVNSDKNYLLVETAVILKDFTNNDNATNEGSLAPLLKAKLKKGMNAIARGEW